MSAKILAALAVITVGSWLACVGFIGSSKYNVDHLDWDCQQYINRALPKIVKRWDYSEWKLRATKELYYSEAKSQKREFRKYPKLLGPYRSMEDPIGRISIESEDGEDFIYGFYTVNVRYKYSNVRVAMWLVKKGGHWRFVRFEPRSDRIDSGY